MIRSVAVVLPAAIAVAAAPIAEADSEFWAEVRQPGLRAYRVAVREARQDLNTRRYTEAVDRAEPAAAAVPDRPEAHVVLALAYGQVGRLAEAIVAAQRALAADPGAFDDPTDGAQLAELAATAGSYELAADVLGRLVGRMPNDRRRAQLFLLYGDVLLTLGPDRLAAAIAAYRETLRHGARSNARALLGLALALRRAGQETEAGDLARRAAELGHFETRIRSIPIPQAEKAARLAVALLAIGDREGARRAFREALEGPWRPHAERELRALRRPGAS